MKNRTLIALLFISGALMAFKTGTETTSYKVIPEKSKLEWKAYKVGGQHEGIVPVKSGNFITEGDLITSGEFTVDMTALEVTDTESNKLTKHLKSGDFFDVNTHPEVKIVIKGSEAGEEGSIKVNADLTIRGTTQPVVFDAKVLGQTENFVAYKAKIKVDRTKYGITYRSSLGDAFIMDEFDVSVKITAAKE